MPTTCDSYDVSRDGRRFIMIKNPPTAADQARASTAATMVVVVNWLEELERLLPEK